MDYLYRLRIKANYIDTGMFAEGPQNEGEALSVAYDLVALASTTLLVYELRLIAVLGRQSVLTAADKWIAEHPTQPGSAGLSRRRPFLGAS